MTPHDRSKTPNIYQSQRLTSQPCRTENRVLNLARKCAQFCAEMRWVWRGNAPGALLIMPKVLMWIVMLSRGPMASWLKVTPVGNDGAGSRLQDMGGRGEVLFKQGTWQWWVGLAMAAVLEFLNKLWGLGTELEYRCRTGPPGYKYTAWRHWFLGIDSWAPWKFKTSRSGDTKMVILGSGLLTMGSKWWSRNKEWYGQWQKALKGWRICRVKLGQKNGWERLG